MDYAAINIGELEVIPETDRWSQLDEAPALPFVSANAVIPSGGRVAPRPYVIREVELAGPKGGSIRVGLLGLTQPPGEAVSIDFADPIERARQFVSELRSQCDVLVVLAQMPLPSAKDLANAVPGIDVVLGAANDTHLARPDLESGTLVCYPYPRGMGLGELRLFLDDSGTPSRYFHRVVPLSRRFPHHPEFIEFEEKAVAEINEAKPK